jgi:hypothetical protein
VHVQENPLSLLGQYSDDDGDGDSTPPAVNGTKVLSLNNANVSEHVDEQVFSCLSSWFAVYNWMATSNYSVCCWGIMGKHGAQLTSVIYQPLGIFEIVTTWQDQKYSVYVFIFNLKN